MKKTLKQDRSIKNRDRLLHVAEQKFSDRGFASTSTEEIVKETGVTRGVLYYHFDSKEDLFLAVFQRKIESIGQEIVEETMARVTSDVEDLQVGTQIMLEVCSRTDVKQIVLIDGPSILGWGKWNELQRPLHLALLSHALQHLVDEKLLEAQPLEPLADIVSGAVMQAALAVAASTEPEVTRRRYGKSLKLLIERLTLRTSRGSAN